MARFQLVIRRRGKVEKSAFGSLAEALDALETETRAAANTQRPTVERVLGRSYEPEQQVAVRAELRGPDRLRAGIDVRGDGSAEAFRGVIRRRPIAAQGPEDAWSALRRSVG